MNIKKNLIFNIALSVSNIIFPIITFPYISRVLGPDGTGVVNFSLAFCEYFVIIAGLGIPLYGIREIAKTRDVIAERSKIFLEIFLIRVFITALILIPYFFTVFNVSKFNENINLYLWGAVYITANIGSIEWFFTGLEDFKYITSRSIIVKALSVILMFIIVKHKGDVLNYFLINIFILVINDFIDLRYALKYLSFKIDWSELQFKKHLKPLIYIFSSLLAVKIYTLVDTVILGFLSTDKAVGFYNSAVKIVRISLTVITSLGTVLIARLSNAVSKNDFEEVNKLLKNSFSFVYTLGIPMMAVIFALAPELVQLFSGHQFTPAVLTLRILCPLILIIGMANVFSVQILTPLGKDRLVMTGSIAGAVVNVLLNLLLIPFFKENGSAISNVVTELLVTVICLFFAKKFMEINLQYKEILLNVTCTLPYLLLPFILRAYLQNYFLIIACTLFTALISFLFFHLYVIKTKIVLETFMKIKNSWKIYFQ